MLRPYQLKAKAEVKNAFANGKQAVILCMPTGAGKTVSFADIAKDSICNGFPVMILCNRKELIAQADRKLRPLGINATLINPTYIVHRESMCYVASVDTLRNRTLPEISLLIVDEAHIRAFDEIVLEYKSRGVFIIGATATPMRTGRKFLKEGTRLAELYQKYTGQLGNVYDHLVEPVTISELLEMEYLVPPVYYGPEIDLSDVGHKGGDFDERDLFKKYNKPKMYSGVIDNYLKYAPGTKALVFNINVEHSKKMAGEFCARNIPAEHVDGKTPDVKRLAIFKRFELGITMVLCNYGVATTGYDEPSIETIILNSATESVTLYLQKVGRGGRLCPEINKSYFNVIDHGSHIRRLGWWQQEREWSLELNYISKINGVGPIRHCEKCEAIIPLSQAVCPHCSEKQERQSEELKLHDAEFVMLEASDMPKELKKPMHKMSVSELEQFRIIKSYSVGWIVRQLLGRGNEALKEYAKIKGYAVGWVTRQEQVAENNRKNAIKPIWAFIKNNPHVKAEYIIDFTYKKLKSTHNNDQIDTIIPKILEVFNNPEEYNFD